MELVIKIPDEAYQRLLEEQHLPNRIDLEYFIVHGTPLPKGHGKLMILSEDKVKENQINLDFSCQKWISAVGLSNATLTIIEKDGD